MHELIQYREWRRGLEADAALYPAHDSDPEELSFSHCSSFHYLRLWRFPHLCGHERQKLDFTTNKQSECGTGVFSEVS